MSTGCAGASESANEDGRRSHHPTLQNPSEQGTQLGEATVPEAFALYLSTPPKMGSVPINLTPSLTYLKVHFHQPFHLC